MYHTIYLSCESLQISKDLPKRKIKINYDIHFRTFKLYTLVWINYDKFNSELYNILLQTTEVIKIKLDLILDCTMVLQM